MRQDEYYIFCILIPGEVISTAIVDAIQNSRKTLVVLTPSFLKSAWCEFEFNMARLEGVTRRAEVVLVVLFESVPLRGLNKDMSVLLRNNSYLEYNDEGCGSVVFWETVVNTIRTAGTPE